MQFLKEVLDHEAKLIITCPLDLTGELSEESLKVHLACLEAIEKDERDGIERIGEENWGLFRERKHAIANAIAFLETT